MTSSLFSLQLSAAMLSRRTKSFLIVTALLLVLPGVMRAQLGNDNPTGISGVYNGNVTTAGSYDPYTGNASRSVTDLSVAGAVGAYPLALTRTMNTRYTPNAGTLEFGQAGTWRHNYQWSIDTQVITSYTANGWTVMPGSYPVNYPDGRRVLFGPGTPFFKAFGVSDRFQQLSNPSASTDNCYLLLPDGGKVWFQVEISRQESESRGGRISVTSTFTYQFVGLIDPYGQLTTVSYGPNTMTIREPAGRTLTLYYISTPWNGDTVIDRVVASDGRTVKYNYGGSQPAGATMYSYLGNVQYLDLNGTSYAQAIYAYQQSNVDPDGRMLLYWAIDPMYGGPMWAISYSFLLGSSGGVYGQLQSENYLDPFTGTPGQAVSSLSVNGNSRIETRGDGPTRTFNYSGGWLMNYTDFKGQPSSISFDANGYTAAFTDALSHTTGTTREPRIGALTVLTHPGDNSTATFSYTDATNPNYLFYRTDERGKTTSFTRNANHQVERIDYPDGGYETFAYNPFGQVTSHRLTSGGTEAFAYDEGLPTARGLRTSYTPPATESDPNPATHPTRYHYDALDRMDVVTDPRGNKTSFQYNTRGQVIRVTHANAGDNTYIQYGYNIDGTVAWMADENHPGAATDETQRTRYTYDVYKRLLTVTNALNQTVTASYALDWVNPLAHTSKNIKYVTSQLNKNVVFGYDENFRKTYQAVAAGTVDAAWTWFEYDAAGNLTSVQDPRNYVTTFGYDDRNRRTSVTDALLQTTSVTYDKVGNRLTLTRPNNPPMQWPDYDSMNRLTRQIDERGITTTMGYDLAGNLLSYRDGNNQPYTYEYDELNRRKKMIYPNTEYQHWGYDEAGNLLTRRSVNGNVQSWEYDNRNRPIWMRFSGGSYWIDWTYFQYDAVGRPKWIQNPNAITQRGYDAAGHLTLDRQGTSGLGDRDVNYAYDGDGNLSRMYIPGTDYDRTYQYDEATRPQKIINTADSALWFQYFYDASSNETSRYSALNNTTQSYAWDELNRMSQRLLSSPSAGTFSEEHYGYDAMSRHTATWRAEDGKLDQFGYDPSGQLNSAQYAWVWNGSTWVSPSRSVAYGLDNNGNRNSVTENGSMNSYSPNNLNQYSQAGPNSVTNGSEHEIAAYAGIAYTYLADTFLSSVSGNGNSYQLVYDGLGRCVKRTLNGVTTYYQYDGDRPIYEYKTDGSTAGWNVYGKGIDEILLRADYVAVPGGQGYFFQQDSQGNVTHLTSFEGTTIESYRYDAFGAPTTTYSGGSFNNRFKFTGREYQSAFGIYEYRHRAYHPGLGRFMSEDPMGFAAGDANLYRYCGNNPGNRSDPFGLVEKKKERESDASGVIVDGHYDFGPNDNGFTELTDRNGGLGFLNQGGGGGGFDWFGGTAFTFANNAAPTSSLWPPPTLGVQPLPPSPDGSPQSTSFYAGIEAGLQWLRDNANLTVDFAQTFGVVPIPAGNAAILVPVGGHAFATIDKSGITLGAGSGIVAASGLVAMSGAPFGQTSGTQLVSQVFGSLGPAGGYYSGILSQSGAATEKGVAIGAGSGIAITLDGTVHFNWPGHH